VKSKAPRSRPPPEDGGEETGGSTRLAALTPPDPSHERSPTRSDLRRSGSYSVPFASAMSDLRKREIEGSRAESSGRRNTSSWRWVNGTTTGLGSGGDGEATDAIARPAAGRAAGASTGVLGGDRSRRVERGCRGQGRCVTGGRDALVPCHAFETPSRPRPSVPCTRSMAGSVYGRKRESILARSESSGRPPAGGVENRGGSPRFLPGR